VQIAGLSFWETAIFGETTTSERALAWTPLTNATLDDCSAVLRPSLRRPVFIAAAQERVMTKPVPAKATGYLPERPAPPFLRGTFSSTWIHRVPEASAPPVIVTPDGTIDVQWIDRMFRIAGPDKDPVIEHLRDTMWRNPLLVGVSRQVGVLVHIISLFLKRIEPREHALVVLPRRRLAWSGMNPQVQRLLRLVATVVALIVAGSSVIAHAESVCGTPSVGKDG
jgi:hypothetical protein